MGNSSCGYCPAAEDDGHEVYHQKADFFCRFPTTTGVVYKIPFRIASPKWINLKRNPAHGSCIKAGRRETGGIRLAKQSNDQSVALTGAA